MINIYRGQMIWDPLAELPSETAARVELFLSKQAAMVNRADHISERSDEKTTLIGAALRVFEYVRIQENLFRQ